MHARLALLGWIDDLALDAGSRSLAITKALNLVELGNLPEDVAAELLAANARAKGARKLSRTTIYDWIKARDTHGPIGLAPASGKQTVQPTWLAPLLKLYQVPQKPALAKCLRDWKRVYPDQPVPAERTANHWLEKLPAEMREFGRMGREARRAVQPFTRRTTDGLWPMDVVAVDGHLFKAFVRHPMTGKRFRPEITTYLDIATRRITGFSAWIAESQMAIWDALRDMVLNPECGVMALHYSDNGAYRGHRHRAVIDRIGGTLMFSQPYRAQARGVIERLNGSVWVPFAKDFPTYCNDDMDKEAMKRSLRRADDKGSGLVHWDDFISQARQALDDYNNRPHSSLNKCTPNEVWEQAIDERWRPTPLENDDLYDLLPSETRTVNRGYVSLPWGKYFDDKLRDYHGRRVSVGFQSTDGSCVWCSDASGALICVAMRDANTSAFVPESELEHARAKREAGRQRRLERKREDIEEEGAMLYELSALDIETRQISRNTVPMRTLDEETEQRLNQNVKLPVRPRELTAIEERDQLLMEWDALDARICAGEAVSERDLHWHKSYQESPEFRVREMMRRDFGDQYTK
jgi:putative transposase